MSVPTEEYIHNIRILSEYIKFICTSFRKRYKSESLIASFSNLFRRECKLILYLTTMYVYYVYPAISKSPKLLPNCLKIIEPCFVLIHLWRQILYCCRICLSLYVNQVPNNAEVFLPPLLVLTITQLQDKERCFVIVDWYL
jgi:hypothetical protein